MDDQTWEFLDPFKVLSKLNDEFYTNLESKKWSERKEALESLKEMMEKNPKLDPKDSYGELVSTIIKVVGKDTNVMVVGVAAQCIRLMADGLRKKFAAFGPMVVPVLIEKFKEKKPVVVTALVDAIDAVFRSVTLEPFMEDIQKGLNHKSPGVKIQVSYFLSRHVRCLTTTSFPKKLLKPLVDQLIVNVAIADPEVRESAASALGSCWKVVGEKPMLAVGLAAIADDTAKMDKIKVFAEEARKKCAEEEAARPKPAAATGASASGQSASSSAAGGGGGVETVLIIPPGKPDPFDMMDPFNVLAKLNEEFWTNLESKKWSERKEALEMLKGLMEKNPKLDPTANYGQLMGSIKTIISKDSNVMVVGMAAQCLKLIAEGLRKKFSPYGSMIIPIIIEKFKEKKPVVLNPLVEAIDAVMKTIVLEPIMEDVTNGLSHKTPLVRIQTAYFLYRHIRSLTTQSFPKKLLQPIAAQLIKNVTESDPEVRESAAAGLGSCMKVVGEKPLMMNGLAAVAEDNAKMDKIKSYRDKAVELSAQDDAGGTGGSGEPIEVPVNEVPPGAKILGPGPNSCAGGGGGAVGGGSGGVAMRAAAPVKEPDPWDMLDPVDVLPKLTEEFYTNLESKKWSERKESLEMLKQLIEKNPRLDPSAHYGELVSTLKNIVAKDSNVMVVSVAAQCIQLIAEGLRKKFGQFGAMIIPVLIEKFKEKKTIVVSALVNAIDAVIKTCNLETVIEDVQNGLSHKALGVKIQTGLFLQRHIRTLSMQTFPKKLLKPIAEQLLKNISEPDPEVRESAAAALGSCMKVVGEKPMMIFLAPIAEDGTKMDKIKTYRDKAQEMCPNEIVTSMVESMHKTREESEAGGGGRTKKPVTRPGGGAGVSKKPAAVPAEEQPISSASSAQDEDNSKQKEKEEAAAREAATAALLDTKQKQQRFADEKALKCLKWTFANPDPEHIEQLNSQLATVTKQSLHSQLFHKDFKQHLLALDVLLSTVDSQPEALIGCADLMLKWSSLRFFDTNPTVLAKTLQFNIDLLKLFTEQNLKLHDFEAMAYLPYLLSKAGDGKENVRTSVKAIVELICGLYPPSKVFPIVMESMSGRNSKQKAVCLEFLASMIESTGMTVVGPANQGVVKQLAAAIGDRDQSVRNGALNCMVAVHGCIGDRIYKQLQQLGNKELAMLEERLKRTVKKGPKITKSPEQAVDPKAVRGRSSAALNIPDSRSRSTTPARKEPLVKESQQNGVNSVSSISRSSSSSINKQRSSVRWGSPAKRNLLSNDQYQFINPTNNEAASQASSSSSTGSSISRDRLTSASYVPVMVPPDDGYFPRKTDGEFDWERMGFHWVPSEFFRTRSPPASDWYKWKEEDDRNPFKFPQLKGGYSFRDRKASSVSTTSISGVMDASTALDSTIAQITSHSITTAIQALCQMDELLKDQGRRSLLTGKIDQTLVAVFFQLRYAGNNHMADDNIDGKQKTDLYRNIGNMLVSLLACTELVKESTEGALKDLIMQLLTTLLDTRFEQLADGKNVIKSVNWLVVKVVEKTDRSACLVALMRLLREALQSQTASPKFQELALKCLWRKCRELQTMMDEPGNEMSLNVGPILVEAQRFYDQFPQSFWQGKDDKPFKTIRTILNFMANGMGDKILDHVDVLDKPESSEVVAYLKKTLGHKADASTSSHQPSDKKVLGESNQNAQTSVKDTQTAAAHNARLAEIFRKIAVKENSSAGIRELYEFKRENPSVDIEPYLKKSSEFFQKYVKRGLESIAEQENNSKKSNGGENLPGSVNQDTDSTASTAGANNNGTASSTAANHNNRSETVSQPDTMSLLNRLNDLRANAGLPPSKIMSKQPDDLTKGLPAVKFPVDSATLTRTPAGSRQTGGGPGSTKTYTRRTVSPEELAKLKRRLELVKKGAL